MTYSGYNGVGYVFGTPTAPTVTPPARGSTPGLRVLLDPITDMNPQAWSPLAPFWTDISSYLRTPGGFRNSLGRQRPLDRNETGTATLVFDNYARVFDPDNDDSPLFGGLEPMRHIRVESVHAHSSTPFTMASSQVGGDDLVGGGDTFKYHALFDGLTEAWTYDYPGLGKDAMATVKCMDLTGQMSRDQLDDPILVSNTIAGSLLDIILNLRWYTGTVEDGNLDVGGIPPGSLNFQGSLTPSPDRDISYDNNYPMGGNLGTEVSGSILSSCQDTAESDGGNFFVSQDGTITYRDRLWNERPVDTEMRFAVDAERFHDVVRQMDETLIFNDIQITTSAGLTQTEDIASQQRYGKRTLQINSQLAFDQDARAQDLLFRHRDPHAIIAKLDLSNVVADWELVLTRTLWDAILLEVPLPNGDVLTQRSQIEGIEVSTPNKFEWNVTWWLSVPPFPDQLDTDFEDATVQGWTAETNCTLAPQDTVYVGPNAVQGIPFAIQGLWSLEITPTSDADLSARSPAITIEGRHDYVATLLTQSRIADPSSGHGPLVSLTTHLEIDWYSGTTFLSRAVGAARIVAGFSVRRFQVSGRSPSGADTAYLRYHVDDADTEVLMFIDAATFTRSG